MLSAKSNYFRIIGGIQNGTQRAGGEVVRGFILNIARIIVHPPIGGVHRAVVLTNQLTEVAES